MKTLFKNGTEKEFNNVRYAYLSGADLSHADLSYADLSGADLRGADLSYADLSGADLSHADLSGADLSHADLRGADLRGADLSYADLSGADLSHADLRGADLRYASLDFSTFPLWCGSFGMKVDAGFVKQLLYHIARLDFEDTEGIREAIIVFANSASLRARHKLPSIEANVKEN